MKHFLIVCLVVLIAGCTSPEEKKAVANKKEVEPKFVDVTQLLVSYKDFSEAIESIAYFDANLCRMGYLKSQKLEN